MLKKIRKNSERGQAIILVAFAIIGMVAMVGLMIDGGILLIEYARLKRGIDSASIAAAAQFRKSFTGDEMTKAAEEFLKFNQADAEVTIFTCAYPPKILPADKPAWNLDDTLCAANTGGVARKLVRVTASREVYFGFMKVLGFTKTTIDATSIGEAASIDMVLAIDTSSSMAYETTGDTLDPQFASRCPSEDCIDPDRSDQGSPGHPAGDDPKVCNVDAVDPTDPGYADYLAQRCEPMGKVKDAAESFVNELFFPYDRVALVAFTRQETNGSATRMPVTILEFNDNQNDLTFAATTEIQEAIRELRVFQPKDCPTPLAANPTALGPCLYYDEITSRYIGQPCLIRQFGNGNGTGDPTSCGASNIGGGLYMAGDRFGNGARTNSFWVVIALMGGPANAAVPRGAASADDGYCPEDTKIIGGGYCRDLDPQPYVLLTNPRHTLSLDPTHYDADDYARDAADYITAPPPNGQRATLFSICMGKPCRTYLNPNDPASAEHLGQYMALSAGGANANHGLYYHAINASELGGPNGVFAKIAENIFTRISQ